MTRRFRRGISCFVVLLALAPNLLADEVDDLIREATALKAELAALRADEGVSQGAVARAVDEYLASRAAGEGGGELAGWMNGKFRLNSSEGDFKLQVGGLVQMDARFYEPHGIQNNTFDLGRTRIFARGRVHRHWNFKVQFDISTSGAEIRTSYIRAKIGKIFGASGTPLDGLTLKVGQFKMPFSDSELTSRQALDTFERPIIVRSLAPGRETGLQLSGKFLDEVIQAAVAISNGASATNDSDEFWYYGRFLVAPFRHADDDLLKKLRVGVNFGTAHTARGRTRGLKTAGDGPYGVPGESDDDTSSRFHPTFPISGRELLLGFEAIWRWKQWAAKTEVLFATQELDASRSLSSRLDGFEAGDDLETWGFYLEIAHMLTGERWLERPTRGWEIVGQIEWGEVDAGGTVPEADYWAYTLGLNHYFNENVRLVVNWVVTDFGDNVLRPVAEDGIIRGGGLDHNLLLRLELAF